VDADEDIENATTMRGMGRRLELALILQPVNVTLAKVKVNY
jgi:hypothetical protein